MKIVSQFFYSILIVLLVFFINLIFLNLLPHPFNQINLIFVFLIWLIIYKSNIQPLWLGVALAVLAELYSLATFGVLLAAIILSLLLVSWFLLNIFTNRSIYIVLVSGFLGLTSFRIFYWLFFSLTNLFKSAPLHLPSSFLNESLWSITLSSIALAVFYSVTSLFITRLKPEYLHTKGNRYELWRSI